MASEVAILSDVIDRIEKNRPGRFQEWSRQHLRNPSQQSDSTLLAGMRKAYGKGYAALIKHDAMDLLATDLATVCGIERACSVLGIRKPKPAISTKKEVRADKVPTNWKAIVLTIVSVVVGIGAIQWLSHWYWHVVVGLSLLTILGTGLLTFVIPRQLGWLAAGFVLAIVAIANVPEPQWMKDQEQAELAHKEEQRKIEAAKYEAEREVAERERARPSASRFEACQSGGGRSINDCRTAPGGRADYIAWMRQKGYSEDLVQYQANAPVTRSRMADELNYMALHGTLPPEE